MSLTLLSTTSPKDALAVLLPLFRDTYFISVRVSYCPGSALHEQIEQGVSADVLIAPADLADCLIKEGKLAPNNRTDFAKSETALAVHKDMPKPILDTPEALVAVLIAARSVSYSRGASGAYFKKALSNLGIEALVAEKTVLPAAGQLVGELVQSGRAAVGIQQFSELLPVPGIEICPLPKRIVPPITYCLVDFPTEDPSNERRTFADFLRSDASQQVLRKYGFDPILTTSRQSEN